MKAKDNILSYEKFKLKQFLEIRGFEWLEDKNGKVKIWIRKAESSKTGFSGFPQGRS